MTPRLTPGKLTKAADDLCRAGQLVQRHADMLTRVTANPRSRDMEVCRQLAKHRVGLRELRREMEALERRVRDDAPDAAKLRDDLSALAESLVAIAGEIGILEVRS